MLLHEVYSFGKVKMIPMMLCFVVGILPIFHVLTTDSPVRPTFCSLYIFACLLFIIAQAIAVRHVYRNDPSLLYFNAAVLVVQICLVGAVVPVLTRRELFSLYALTSCTQVNLLMCLSKLYENLGSEQTIDKNCAKPSGKHPTEGPRKVKCVHTLCELFLSLFGTFLAVFPAVECITGNLEMTVEFCTLGCIWGVVSTAALLVSVWNVRKRDQMLFPIHLVILLMQALFVSLAIPVLEYDEFVGIFSFTSSVQVIRFLHVMKFYEKLACKNATSASHTRIILSA